MDNEELLAHLTQTFSDARESGETAIHAGIAYNTINKTFGIVIGGDSFSLPANFLTDHPKGGDELANRIKHWTGGDRAE